MLALFRRRWMKMSTLRGLEAGSVIIRDLRAWHGVGTISTAISTAPRLRRSWAPYLAATHCVVLVQGTPNLSDHIRSIPNVEYCAPWFYRTGMHQRTLPYEVREMLY
jgi:hypothetical protein